MMKRFIEIIVNQNEKMQQLEKEIRRLRSISNDQKKYQQAFVEGRKQKNIVKEHDDKIKAVEKKRPEECGPSYG